MGRGAIRGLLIMSRNLAEEGFDDVLSDNVKSKEGRKIGAKICSVPGQGGHCRIPGEGPAQSGPCRFHGSTKPFLSAHRSTPWVALIAGRPEMTELSRLKLRL
jgi:hypothetical protein